MFKYIPNILTISRFIFIPFILISISNENYVLAIILLTLSGITDILDGFIARKFNFITNFGKLIDPLADKATQISVLVALMLKDIIPFWFIAIIFLKEFIMVAGASFLYGKELVVSSKWYGKLTTVLFYLAIVTSFIICIWNAIAVNNYGETAFVLPKFDLYIYYLALAFTIFSLVMYFNEFYKKGYLDKNSFKINNKEE